VGEVVTNASLTFVSKISHWGGGPGPFKFVALGAIVGALVGIVGDVCLLVGATPFPGMEAAMDLKKWFLKAFNLYAETDPIGKTIKVLLTVAAIGFAIYHIHHTMHELKGHGEHKEGEEAKPGQPVKPGDKPETSKPDQKPVAGTTPAPAPVK
jgi:fumarate reductase subunit D